MTDIFFFVLGFFLILDIYKRGPQTDPKTAVVFSILSRIIGARPMNRSVYHHVLAVLVVSAAFGLYEGWWRNSSYHYR